MRERTGLQEWRRVNRNKKPRDDDLKEIKDMLKQDVVIRNLEAHVRQLVVAFYAQPADIVDSSQKELVLDVKIEVLSEEDRLEHQQSIEPDFEDVDVVEEILESTKEVEDINLVDSSVIGVEDVENLEVHVFERVGPHSKHFSTLCLDGEIVMDLYEHKKQSKEEVDEPYILKFSRSSRQGLGKDSVMRHLSGEEETSIPAPKPMKDKKRKKTSPSEDPEPKEKKARKPRNNIIPPTKESIRRLREEDKEEEEDDSRLTEERNALNLLGKQKEEQIKDLRAELATAHKDQTDLIEQVMKILKAHGLDSRTMANISITQLQQKIERFRDEVDMIKAESLGWKEGMDRFDTEKETARAQLSSVESQLQGMKDKSLTQARKIEELEAQWASELAKAKSEAEKAKAEAEAIVAVY
ncbi:uncharacterized protein [Nicotiana tomentosiformis]|uniref:uncharacterized protein n=1 Tax=Nicotiana tomentosiformis TaxID=4098 RepID=UPI00388C341C